MTAAQSTPTAMIVPVEVIAKALAYVAEFREADSLDRYDTVAKLDTLSRDMLGFPLSPADNAEAVYAAFAAYRDDCNEANGL